MARDWSPVCSAWSDISSMDSASIIAGTLFLLAPADTARSRAASAESRRMLTGSETGPAFAAGAPGPDGCGRGSAEPGRMVTASETAAAFGAGAAGLDGCVAVLVTGGTAGAGLNGTARAGGAKKGKER